MTFFGNIIDTSGIDTLITPESWLSVNNFSVIYCMNKLTYSYIILRYLPMTRFQS